MDNKLVQPQQISRVLQDGIIFLRYPQANTFAGCVLSYRGQNP
jgi:hypothetical protein